MKRSGIKRHGRLRPVSARRRKQNAACNHQPEFAAKRIGTPCWLCLEEGVPDPQPAEEVHHGAGRNHPLRHHRANLFPLCAKFSPYNHHANNKRPVNEMFRLKKKYDPEGYDAAVVALVYRGKCGRRDV